MSDLIYLIPIYQSAQEARIHTKINGPQTNVTRFLGDCLQTVCRESSRGTNVATAAMSITASKNDVQEAITFLEHLGYQVTIQKIEGEVCFHVSW